MAKQYEDRVHTVMNSTEGKIGETISKPMVDFHCDCTANEDFLWDIYSPDCGVWFRHKIMRVPIREIGDISNIGGIE